MQIDSGNKVPYDPEEWRIDRFKGVPPPMQWLVKDFIPLGIAGTLYSVGGAGKSTLALVLAVRIAIALTFKNRWLDFPVEQGGAVAYFSAEEPEDVLHRRLKEICSAIAEEEMDNEEAIFKAALDNLYLANLWGKVDPLFKVTPTTLEASPEFTKILDALKLIQEKIASGGNPLRLIVIDTRSRFSGAEGAGNALVSREVALFEKLAHDTGATVLILHHVNKASLYGGNAMAASRGESAFLDCLRFSIHMETLSPESAGKNGIPEDDRSNHLVITNSKQNYGKLKGPIVIHRVGYRFEKTGIKAREGKAEQKERCDQQDQEAVLGAVRKNSGCSQQYIIREMAKKKVSHGRCRSFLAALEIDGLISAKPGPHGAKQYSVIEVEAEDPEP